MLLRLLDRYTGISSRLNLASIRVIKDFIRMDDGPILIRVNGHNPRFRVPFAV